jgi:hypothetical protein
MPKLREPMLSFALKDATKVTIQHLTPVSEAHMLRHISFRKRYVEGAATHLWAYEQRFERMKIN